MRSERQLRDQLRQVERMQHGKSDDPRTHAELYGIAQTLAWVLERDVMAPALCAAPGWPDPIPTVSEAR